MKKILSAAALAAILLLQANVLPPKSSHLQASGLMSPQEQRRLTYEWYDDPWFYSFTGSLRTINDELARLRNLYPGYTFSGTPGAGLSGFEWGYYPDYVTAVIYSNY